MNSNKPDHGSVYSPHQSPETGKFSLGTVGKFVRDVSKLAAPVLQSEQKKNVLRLFAAVLALSLCFVQLTVTFNYWKKDFFDAIQAMDKDSFRALLLTWYLDAENGIFGLMPGFATAFCRRQAQVRLSQCRYA